MGFADMDSTGETLPSPAVSDEKKRPGRPRQAGTETHKQKVERLQDELRQAQTALKQSEEKRALIVGHATVRHARHHKEFARALAAALRTEVKAKADRAAISDLLDDSQG